MQKIARFQVASALLLANSVVCGAGIAENLTGYNPDQIAARSFDIEENYYTSAYASNAKNFSSAVHRLVLQESGEIDMYVTWRFSESGIEGSEKSRLTKNYSTIRSHIVVSKDGSDYRIERTADTVRIYGLFKNSKIDKSITIDNHPFYTNPTIGLKGFLYSGMESDRFWLLRPDKPEILQMKVERQDDEIIEVRGRQLNASRLKWGLTGIKALFFSEVYWYDREKFVFLKNISRDGIITEIVSDPDR